MEIASFSTYFNQSQLGMPRGTQEFRSLRSLELFPCPVTRWLEFRNLSPPQSLPLFPEFPWKATILTIFYIFWNLLQKNCAPYYILDAVMSSGILKAKQKLGRTFNSNKLGGIAFTKMLKLTMNSA